MQQALGLAHLRSRHQQDQGQHNPRASVQQEAIPTAAAPSAHPTEAPTQPAASAESYAKPFCEFLTNNPTVFHAVDAIAKQLESEGFSKLSERDIWRLKRGGKYYIERNGSSMIAFVVGEKYEAGNGAAILAGHVDAVTTKLKPISKLRTKAGYVQLGVAPYAGGLNTTWWDRDLGIGGRVLVKESGKIVTKLVKLDWPSMSSRKLSRAYLTVV